MLLAAADAAGALLAGVLLERRPAPDDPAHGHLLAMLWCVALGAFAGHAYPLALVLLFTAGFFELSFSSMAQTLVQLHAPAERRGRVIGLLQHGEPRLAGLHGITIGLVGSLIGIHWSLALSALVILGFTSALLGVGAADVRGAE